MRETAWELTSQESGGPCAGGTPAEPCGIEPSFAIRTAGEIRLRKARMSCIRHLRRVITDMQDQHGLDDREYTGEYLLSVAPHLMLRTACGHSLVTCHTNRCFLEAQP